MRPSWDSDSMLVVTVDIGSGDDSSGKVVDERLTGVCQFVALCITKAAKPTMDLAGTKGARAGET